MLSKKMKITVSPKDRVKRSIKHWKFYGKYASIVLNTLRKPRFQRFLRWILTRENIDERDVRNVHIRMFPFQKQNGKTLAGKCRNTGEIIIYPKRLAFCRKLILTFEEQTLHRYIKCRARATVIHELLHLKYSSDEEHVRTLTKKYFQIFTQPPNAQKMNMLIFPKQHGAMLSKSIY